MFFSWAMAKPSGGASPGSGSGIGTALAAVPSSAA